MVYLYTTYLKPYWKQISVIMGLLLVQAISSLYLPELNADIINNGVAKGDTDYILRIGGIMLGASLVLGITSIVGVYFGARVAMGFGRDVRSAIFRKVETFSQVEVNKFGSPSLITRNTNDVQQVQMVVFMGLTLMISAPILIIGGIIMALQQDVPLSGLLVVVLPIMVAFIALVMSRAIPLFQAMQKKVDRINQVMRETLSGVRVIRVDAEQRFLDALVRLLLARPMWKLRQPRPARTTCRVKVTHNHVIEQNVMQPPRGQFCAAEMRVDIENGDSPECIFERLNNTDCVHK